MIGNIIQSYLVSLGVQIDRPGFQQADQTIRATGANIERVTSGMARNFVKAQNIIASAIAGVTASALGLMRATANQDLAMQKYARSMMMSEDAAWRMKKATDALGESINDIALTPELLGRFNKLTADGSQMKVGGDFKDTMKDFRDLIFEFTRLKQEASYALNWVGYYLMKYLQKPLADIRERFKAFNDAVIKGMSVWTEKVARGIYYVIEVGRHFLEFIVDVGKHLKDLWDSFPKGAKIAIAAIAAINAALSAGPLGRSIMLISTLLLLIDDYYGYMEGKNAALGPYWDKLNEYLEQASQWYETMQDVLGTITEYLKDLWDILVKIITSVQELLKFLYDLGVEFAKTDAIDQFTASVSELWQTFKELCAEVYDFIDVALNGMFGQFNRTDVIHFFRMALQLVFAFMTHLNRVTKFYLGILKDLFKAINENKTLVTFWKMIGEAIDGALGKLGKFAKAMVAFLNGNPKKAVSILLGDDDKKGSNAGTGDTDWNKRVVYERFKAAGYSDEAIAGIMGRVQQEHNFDTSDVPEYDDPETGLHLGGYGMFQWNGGRKTDFINWANANGLNPQDPGVQADYAIIEAKERGLGPDTMNSMGVSRATTVWRDKWEVGVPGNEQSYAADIYSDIKHGAPWLGAQPQNAADGSEIGGGFKGDLTVVNSELRKKFSDAVEAMRKKGYSFYVQSTSENSIGFTTPATDYHNIEDVLRSYGLSVSRDNHGFYVSLGSNPEGTSEPGKPGAFSQIKDYAGKAAGIAWNAVTKVMPISYNSDLVNGLLSGGAGGYQNYGGSSYNSQSASVINNVNVDLTINGEGKTNADVGQVTADTVVRNLESRAAFQQSNIYNGSGGPAFV